MAHDIFISYSTKDSERAEVVCNALEANDIRCWIAPRNITPGVKYAEAIVNAINGCKVFLLILSAASNESPQVENEVERATSKYIPILSFRIDQVELAKSLEHYLSSRQWLDASQSPLEKHLPNLVRTIQRLLNPDQSQSVVPQPPKNAQPARFEISDELTLREDNLLLIVQGQDRQTHQPVRLTWIKPGMVPPADFLSRFAPLAESLARVDSPHLAKVLDFGEKNGQAVIVQEAVEGKTLASILAGGEGLPVNLALDIARQLEEYLDALHKQGLFQSVFESESILLTPENIIHVTNTGIPQGVDIAKLLFEGRLKAAYHHAPELLRGEQADARTDFYSLGAVLFIALTGKEPESKSPEGKTPTLTDLFPIRLPAGPPPELDDLVARCLHPNPSKRIQSGTEFRNKLKEVQRSTEAGVGDALPGVKDSLVGQTLGAYQLVERLGQGGMATVYKAYEPGLDRYVAVKVLPQFFVNDPTFSQRFRREAKAVAKFSHPNIVPIYNFGEDDGINYIVMQLMEGGSLKRERGQVYDWKDALHLLLPITRALEYAHQRGIVARDIKPSNVLLTDDQWPVLADFGLAQMSEASARLTGTGVGLGTPAYMSPEQGQGGRVDARSDLYSLGIMLYEMVTGDVPFKADTPMAIVIKHLTAPIPLPRQMNPAIPKEIEAIILKATSKDPAGRFESAEEMAAAMDRALNRVSMPREKPAPKEKPPAKEKVRVEKPKREEKVRVMKPAFRLKPVHILALVLVILLVLGGVFGPRLLANLKPEPTATATAIAATPEPVIIIVTSAEDSGAGTLRQALLDAQAGDTITFDPGIFPPDRPTSIFPTSIAQNAVVLPGITQGGITIDASNAGVSLDGSKLQGDSLLGLVIHSDHNTIMGLQVVNFSGMGIYLEGGSYNRIGGDRSIGTGPFGQGNLLGSNYVGISILSTSGGNIITGNLIGTDASGVISCGNWKSGILIEDLQEYHPLVNTIGPDNIIAYNGSGAAEGGENITGGVVMDTVLIPTTITANSIYNNTGPGIVFNVDDPAQIKNKPPVILFFDIESGVVSGQACHDCSVEIFSTDTQDGRIYEGSVTADEFDNFTFRKGGALTGPFLTATAGSSGNNTSEFSQATSAISAIQIALDAIQSEVPFYQYNFDSLDFVGEGGNVREENGKLIVTSENQGFAVAHLYHNSSLDKFAVEFDLRILESSPEGSCIYAIGDLVEINFTDVWANFFSNGQASLEFHQPDLGGVIAVSENTFDFSKSSTVRMIILGDQVATFVNGQMAYTTRHPSLSTVYIYHGLYATNTIACEYDNFKLWDLSGVDFNP